MNPRHYKTFLKEASNILNQHKSSGFDFIDSLYFTKRFLKSVGINATSTQIVAFEKDSIERS